MKRNLLAAVAGGVTLALAAGCAHGNGSASAAGVRIATNAQDVAGCEKLTQVRLSGTLTAAAAREELQNLVRSKGGNVLLIAGGEGTPSSGVAYRCSGGTTSGSP
ncbi:MAG: hypothetical protein ACRD3M_05705 [Thermoanaerobaculia bacterium]